jgi:membrane protease subunit HflK
VTLRTGEVRREEIGADQSGRITLVTGDENFIELVVVVQYTVGRLGAFLFGVEDPRTLLAASVRGALVEIVAAMPVDDILTGAKARIQQEARRLAQAALDRAGAGITLVGVNLQSVNPPPEAAQAFRAVSDARADAATAINDAESARERAINLARGEAIAVLNDARGAAATRIQRARGATDRFAALLAQRRAAPAQTHFDLYLASAQRLLPRAELVVLAPGEPPRIDLNLVPPRPAMTRPTPAAR